jgi:hypothetical protein
MDVTIDSQILSRGSDNFTALTVHAASRPMPFNRPVIMTVSRCDVVIHSSSRPDSHESYARCSLTIAGKLVLLISGRTHVHESGGQ